MQLKEQQELILVLQHFIFILVKNFLQVPKDIVKPAYQTNIENTAQLLGITIEWRGLSNIEAQLMQDKRLTICRNVFFQADSAVQECCENLKKHKEDIFNHIGTQVSYNDKTIILENNVFNINSFAV